MISSTQELIKIININKSCKTRESKYRSLKSKCLRVLCQYICRQQQLQSISFSFAHGNSRSKSSFGNSDIMHKPDEMEELEHEINDFEGKKHSNDHYHRYLQLRRDIQFVEMLGNPRYVVTLFEQGYFSNENFIHYLQFLKIYLKKPKMTNLVKYPEGLYNLDLMLRPGFVETMKNQLLKKRFIIDAIKRNQQFKNNFRWWDNLPPN